MLPPKWVRRVVITPIAWVVIVALVAIMPVALVIALIGSLFGSRRLRAPRVLWMATVYLALESIALVVLLGLWIGSGFGWKLSGPAFQNVYGMKTHPGLVPFSQPGIVTIPLGFVVLVAVSLLTQPRNRTAGLEVAAATTATGQRLR